MADIFREVDEELQQERAEKVWKKYGGWIITVALAIVLGVAGNVAYNKWKIDRQANYAERYATAVDLVRDGKAEDAASMFKDMAGDVGEGYGLLAKLGVAMAHARAGDKEAAAAAYLAMANDSDVPQAYADLARLRGVQLRIGSADGEALRGDLAPLLKEGGAWYPLAREAEAMIALKAGARDEAAKIYQAIAADPASPQRLKARAGEMISALAN